MKKELFLVVFFFALGYLGVSAQNPVGQIIKGLGCGQAVRLPAPEYPAAAKAVSAVGAVNVAVVINENGDVISATAVSGHPLLRSVSEKAALEAKFKPTLLSGNPVKVSGVIVYNFEGPVGKETPTISEDTGFMGLIASLQLMRNVNSDPELEPVADVFFEEFAKELADSTAQGLELYTGLATASKQRRTAILSELDEQNRKDLKGNQPWELAAGEVLGNLMTESLRLPVAGHINVDSSKANLSKLKSLMESAPAAIPEALRKELTELVGFAESEDLAEPAVSKNLVEKIDMVAEIVLK